MSKIIDISLPLKQGMIAWPGDTSFSREEHRGTAIVSKLTMSSHSGTHIDAPRHFLFSRFGVDKLALDKLVGPARVAASKAKNLISLEEVKKLNPRAGQRILFKTRNAKLYGKKFTANYVSLSLEAAKYLASRKISLIGADYYGIEAKSAPGHPVHKTLLRAAVIIVEGLDLRKVKPGRYQIAALPLRLLGADGSPARVMLWK